MIWYACLLLFLVGTASSGSASSEITLVKNGQPTCSIVLAPDAGDLEKVAASDLQLYLKKMSGAEVPIGADASVAGNRILIGVFGQEPVKEWKGEPLGTDALAIETRTREGGGADLFLIGGDQRGAQYAVYELLERFLGVRWYMPCELGEDVPVRKTIKLRNLNWRNQPDYDAVAGLIWAGGPGAKDWLRRNKGDLGSSTRFFGHAWDSYIAPTEENKEKHPEWFALNEDGTRSDQVCTTNPEVIRIFIDKILDKFEREPDAALASLSPNDGYGFCTCENCRAIDAQYGVTDGSVTDRFIHFANTILKETKKKYPDKMVGILAYVNHTRPPVSAVPDDNYASTICHMPWEFCHVHAIADQKCKPNARFHEMIIGWTKVCKHVAVYEYYGHFYVMAPWPLVHNISKDLPYLRKIGVTALHSETQQHWANQGINFYLTAKLVWDVDRDADAILNEFYDRFYGPAKKPMRKYWEAWEVAMAKQECAGYSWVAMFTPELLEKTGKLLDEAEKLAAKNEKISKRLALHRVGYRFTVAYAAMRLHGEAGDLEKAVACGEEAIRIAQESEGWEPQAFWIWLTAEQTKHQMLPYKKKLDEQRGVMPEGDEPTAIFQGEQK